MAASPVVVDTHSAVWYLAKSDRISANAFSAIDEALTAAVPVYVSAISLVELTYLTEHNRVPREALSDLLRVLKDGESSLVIAPVDLATSEALACVSRTEVPDMPDRIIAATAVALGLPLVTVDKAIRSSTSVETIW